MDKKIIYIYYIGTTYFNPQVFFFVKLNYYYFKKTDFFPSSYDVTGS